MRLHDIHELADKGLQIYTITRDPLTMSAAKILLQTTSSDLTAPQRSAVELLQRQVEAYSILYIDPLV